MEIFPELRAEQADGFVPRTKEEVDASIEEMRDDTERAQEIFRIQEEARRHREQANE